MQNTSHRSVANIVIVLAVFLAAAAPAHAQAGGPPTKFDHTILVNIETVPPGATVYAVSTVEDDITTKLGVSPCIAAIGFKWDERFGRKNWKGLTTWCPGDACRFELNEKKNYDVYFAFAAVKRGYEATNVEVKVATLAPPGFGWEPPATWPRDVHITLPLEEKEPVLPEAAKIEQEKPREVRKMILAMNKNDTAAGLGTVQVRSDAEKARIYVDGKFTGRAPLDILMPEGEHRIILKANGLTPFSQDVSVMAGQTNRVDAALGRE